MLATILHGAGDVRYERVEDPQLLRLTDALIQLQ